MQIPIDLNAAQYGRLRALLTHGEPNLFVVDQKVGGQAVYLLMATGEARDWVLSTLTPEAEATTVPDPGPPDPPAKVVAVTTGPHTVKPGMKRPS